ncbi:hypothetical protein GCM10017744_002030 [Streptomyces antimycoticus]|uniref:Uncharacterized protein n=1 Tax=Streptomyces antimycoticus TaxID=68175 RepID=A0A4D4KQP7_9ACTN|nr:hypothetical protein SANT12839_097620 [Streptomyces antimycoticus]
MEQSGVPGEVAPLIAALRKVVAQPPLLFDRARPAEGVRATPPHACDFRMPKSEGQTDAD